MAGRPPKFSDDQKAAVLTRIFEAGDSFAEAARQVDFEINVSTVGAIYREAVNDESFRPPITEAFYDEMDRRIHRLHCWHAEEVEHAIREGNTQRLAEIERMNAPILQMIKRNGQAKENLLKRPLPHKTKPDGEEKGKPNGFVESLAREQSEAQGTKEAKVLSGRDGVAGGVAEKGEIPVVSGATGEAAAPVGVRVKKSGSTPESTPST